MSITCYEGLFGSGKTYTVVESVILPALADGRRIVTNISGLNIDEIRAYLILQGVEEGSIGEIVDFDFEMLGKPGFFPAFDQKNKVITRPGFVKGGDLVIVDEAWDFWPPLCPSNREHQVFFRCHRQIVDDNGVSCDIVLITQDNITDLDRKIRSVIETTYRTKKHKLLGWNSRFVVDVFERSNTRKKAVSSFQKKYEPSIFSLYSSYSKSKGVEKEVDKRGNIFSNPAFIRSMVFGVVVIFGGFWAVWRFFHPDLPVKNVSGGSKSVAESPNVGHGVEPQKKTEPASFSDAKYRLVGSAFYRNQYRVLVEDENGKRFSLLAPGYFWKFGALGVDFGGNDRAYSWLSGLPRQSPISPPIGK